MRSESDMSLEVQDRLYVLRRPESQATEPYAVRARGLNPFLFSLYERQMIVFPGVRDPVSISV